MDQLIDDFKEETNNLVTEMMEILEKLEDSFEDHKDLSNFGQLVDRIMGGAKSLELMDSPYSPQLKDIGNYAEICKIVAYRGSQIESNASFFNIVVALLMDATEMLADLIFNLKTESQKEVKEVLTNTFLERLKLINQQFDQSLRGSLDISKDQGPKGATQNEIDELMKSLGV